MACIYSFKIIALKGRVTKDPDSSESAFILLHLDTSEEDLHILRFFLIIQRAVP